MNQTEIRADLLISGSYLYLQDQNRKTIKNGGIVMKNRCLTTLDEAAILSRIDNLAKKIKKRHR